MKRAAGLLITVLLAGGAHDLTAQRAGRSGARQRAQLEERIRGRFDAMVEQRLGLTDEQNPQLQEVLAGFRERRRQFLRDQQQARRELMRLGAEGGLTEERASGALEVMIRLGEEELRLFREEQEALMEVLTARQLLRFVVMRRELEQRIQNIRQGRSRGGSGPPGSGGGGGGWGPPGGLLWER